MSTEAKLTRLQVRWKAKPGYLAPATMSIGTTLRSLDEAGYILGFGSDNATAASYVHADARSNTVSIYAWFIGAGAWTAAAGESERKNGDDEDQAIFAIDDFGLASPRVEVIDLSRDSHRPYPSSKASLASRPTLRLCATPGSRCPPLLAAKGGVIAQWKLPLTGATRNRLAAWNNWARLVVAMMDPLGDSTPYGKWARRELRLASSPVVKEARALAKEVTRETGLKVDTSMALFEIFAS